MDDRADPFPGFDEAAAALTPDGPPRVWSLIVTVLGDNSADPDFEIGAGPLARILEPAGVTGPAMRVALHRLRRDGWITTRRDGRSAIYRLASTRQPETRAAGARIYATEPPPPGWHLRIADPDAAAPEPPARDVATALAPRMILHSGPAPDAFAFTPSGPAPDWIRARICPPDLMQAYRTLHAGLATAEAITRAAPPSADPRAMALRLLTVHAWRRVLLRHPPFPDDLFPADWPGPDCRALVATLLARLPRPTADDLAAL
ncbi:PaaX family transcriptional regulator [Rhodobacterales bacterium HKCCE3408]|nr:PaaX family transcriptional regulator [Rhodobacterales bacterium HKCCE3408]